MWIIKVVLRLIKLLIHLIKNGNQADKYRNMGTEDLLALDDEDLYDAVSCICEDVICELSDETLNNPQRYVYSLIQFEMEVNNGGLCQFFVNSSSECAPYISSALAEIGASEMQHLYDNFISSNNIDVNDLSSFKIDDIDEYEDQTERYDFDSFDDKFYDDTILHQQIIDYARNKIEYIIQ